MAEPTSSDLAGAIQDVTEKAELLVREEIALAKAEMTEKVTKLIRGAIFGIVAGIFAVFALIYLLDALAWGLWRAIDGSGTNYWIGFLIVGIVLILLGAVGGFIALRQIKGGTPPTPQMAIEEAQLIRGTLTSPQTAEPVGPIGSRQAPAPAPAERR